MRLFAALGSGDIVAAHRAQMAGKPITSETSIIYSGQFLEFCRAREIETLAISHNARRDSVVDGPLHLENIPFWFTGKGALFHLSMILRAVYLAYKSKRFRADVAVIDSGSTHYFALIFFFLLGMPVVVNFHNTLWPSGLKPKRFVGRMISALDAWFFRRIASAAIGVSPECGSQVRQLAGAEFYFIDYRCQFRKDEFKVLQAAEPTLVPFRMLFAGRVERNKGVFDVVAMAEQIREKSSIPVVFEICGAGSAFSDLQHAVKERRLDEVVLLRGRLERPALLSAYSRSHAVIVPTRMDFCEGMPQVCAEAILSNRPLVTSRLSNAIPVLGPALLEAQPEKVEDYVEAILKLAGDSNLYTRLVGACPELAKQFFDRSRSLPAATDRTLAHIFPGWKLLENYEPLFRNIS